MMRISAVPVVALLAAMWIAAAVPAVSARQSSTSPDYTFGTPIGVLVFHVRPEAATEFESVLARIQQGFETTADATRKQQAKQLRVLRAAEPAAGAVLFVFLIDPVVPGADYDPVRMLTELVPAESAALFERLKAAVVKIERVSLSPVLPKN